MQDHRFVVHMKYEKVPLTMYRWNGTSNKSILLKEYAFYHLIQLIWTALVKNTLVDGLKNNQILRSHPRQQI